MCSAYELEVSIALGYSVRRLLFKSPLLLLVDESDVHCPNPGSSIPYLSGNSSLCSDSAKFTSCLRPSSHHLLHSPPLGNQEWPHHQTATHGSELLPSSGVRTESSSSAGESQATVQVRVHLPPPPISSLQCALSADAADAEVAARK